MRAELASSEGCNRPARLQCSDVCAWIAANNLQGPCPLRSAGRRPSEGMLHRQNARNVGDPIGISLHGQDTVATDTRREDDDCCHLVHNPWGPLSTSKLTRPASRLPFILFFRRSPLEPVFTSGTWNRDCVRAMICATSLVPPFAGSTVQAYPEASFVIFDRGAPSRS